jgi:hypothetical protein
MGRNEEARETFRKALQRNAESEPAREGLEIAEQRILQGSAASP